MSRKVAILAFALTILGACSDGPYFRYDDDTKQCGIVTDRSNGKEPQGHFCKDEK